MIDEKNTMVVMSEEQFEKLIEAISETTADKVTKKLEQRFFVAVGKAVFERGLAMLGLGAIGLVFLWQNKIWPFDK